MRHRIPCRSAPQCSPQTRTTCALALRNVAHGPAHFRRAIRSQCCAQSAALPPCSLCAMPRTTCCPMQPLKSYNRMQMQLASSAAFPEPLLAAMPQLREKPRLGFSSKNPALHQGHEVCNSTTALGLQAALHLERIRSRYTGKERDNESGNDYFEARYFGSIMGRFLSPDPVSGTRANPQSLNRYVYVLNNPLRLTDPTGMIVDWEDSKKGKDGLTDAQRGFEKRLNQMCNSNDPKERAAGEGLQKTYGRLQDSKATFEVIKPDRSGSSSGDIQYDGNNHFTINLKGDMSNAAGFTNNQKIAHEFEHGRQVLDGEMSFKQGANGKWQPFAHDLTDEAKAMAAGFAIEGATPGQSSAIRGMSTALRNGGISGEVDYLGSHIGGYHNLPGVPVNVPNPPPPGVYEVPK